MRGNYKLKKKIKKQKFQKGGIYNLYATDFESASKDMSKKYSHDESIEISKNFVDKENGVMLLIIDNIYKIFVSSKSIDVKYKKIKKIIDKHNSLLSSFDDNQITITSWVKGPPMLYVGNNYDINHEESYSISLCTFNICFNESNIYHSIHQNGIVVSLHAIARFIERYEGKIKDSIIRNELFSLIPYAIVSNKYVQSEQSNVTKTPFISNNGVWLGTTILSKDTFQKYNIPVSFIRTFISKNIMSKDQLLFLSNNLIKENFMYNKKIFTFLKNMNTININDFDYMLDIMNYSKFIFTSDDKFIERVSPDIKLFKEKNDMNIKYKSQFIKPKIPSQ